MPWPWLLMGGGGGGGLVVLPQGMLEIRGSCKPCPRA